MILSQVHIRSLCFFIHVFIKLNQVKLLNLFHQLSSFFLVTYFFSASRKAHYNNRTQYFIKFHIFVMETATTRYNFWRISWLQDHISYSWCSSGKYKWNLYTWHHSRSEYFTIQTMSHAASVTAVMDNFIMAVMFDLNYKLDVDLFALILQ